VSARHSLLAGARMIGGSRVAVILVIDDEESVRSFFCYALEGAGYDVVEASSAKQGLRLLRDRPVDLVITDILMPDMDGLEVTRVLHREFPRVKVIAVSGGQQDIDYCNVARFLGAHATLMKPVSVQRLIETVANLLSQAA
jgi:DNA-binding NtrC family response regulator